MSQVIPLKAAATMRARAVGTEPQNAQAQTGPRWSGLMARAQDGDRDAYHTLLQELAPYLRAICRRYLGNGNDVEDAVQDILLVVHSIRHTYARDRPFKPWLSTIASRCLVDLLRARTRRLRHEIETGIDKVEGSADDVGAQPDRFAAQVHTAREVHRAVAALPPRQREAVALLRLQELSPGEAAGVSRHSAGALKVACHRALKSLHALLHDKMLRDRNRP